MSFCQIVAALRIGRCHRGGVQGEDVPVVADGRAEPVGGAFVAGDHDPGGGGDIDEVPA